MSEGCKTFAEERGGVRYRVEVWLSSHMDPGRIADFISVQRQVFTAEPMTEEYFDRKFLKNIYGDSVLVLLYDEAGSPAAARAFWRNDLGGRMAYQPSDTAVCKEHRRRGLFVVMTRAALEAIGPEALVYNFPNENSYPQYKKLGWEDYKIQYTRIFTPWEYRAENGSVIDPAYFAWWIRPGLRPTYGAARVGGGWYLVRRLNDKGRYLVFGRLTEENAAELPRVRPRLLVYHSVRRAFYAKKLGCRIVALPRRDRAEIPDWKTDVL